MRQRDVLLAQVLDDAQAVQTGHLHIQENHVGFEILDQLDGLQTIAAGGQDLDLGKFLQ